MSDEVPTSTIPPTETLEQQKAEVEEIAPSNNKRSAPDTPVEEPETKRPKREPLPERDVAAIRTQLEYYCSDKNLTMDQFFYDLLKNDGVIPFEKLLSCRKLVLMKADQDLIKEAVKGSSVIEVSEKGLTRKAPLPTFIGKNNNNRRNDRKPSHAGNLKNLKPVLIHDNGAVVCVSNLQEDTVWGTVKEAVNNALKTLFEGVKTPKGTEVKPVNFCGQKTAKGTVHMILSRMDHDLEKLSKITEIEIAGEKFPFFIEHNQQIAQNFFKTLPKQMLKSLGPRPFNPKVNIGGAEFESVEHLRKCCKELLEVTPIGNELTNNGAAVLKELLSYHPDGSKIESMTAVKVALHPTSTEKNPIRSFFVAKPEGDVDFSYLKCLTAFTMKLVDVETSKLRTTPAKTEEAKTEEAKTEEAKAEETQ